MLWGLYFNSLKTNKSVFVNCKVTFEVTFVLEKENLKPYSLL